MLRIQSHTLLHPFCFVLSLYLILDYFEQIQSYPPSFLVQSSYIVRSSYDKYAINSDSDIFNLLAPFSIVRIPSLINPTMAVIAPSALPSTLPFSIPYYNDFTPNPHSCEA